MNTVLVRCHFVRKKQYTKKTKRKTHSESRDINENDIIQGIGKMFGIFRLLVAKWRGQAFVYDVIGNMAMATSVDIRGDSSYRKR